MTTSVVTLDGVDIRSAPVMARDCSFPITDFLSNIPKDQVFDNTPIFYGGWEDGTVAPAFRNVSYNVDVTTNAGDECRSPVVNYSITTCELEAPNMQEISFETPRLKIRDLMTKFCRARGIAPGRFSPFDQSGNIVASNPMALDFERYALQGIYDVLGHQFIKSAMVGDASNINEFDGFYNQLENGWAPHGSTPCPDALNKATVIDWGALCGKSSGTAAMADDVTVTGKTISVWGETIPVPVGVNLAQFLNDFWIEKVNMEFADRHGGITLWEAHIEWGKARTFLNTAACMRPCDGRDDDPEMRSRLAQFRNTNIATLYPSGVSFPFLQSRYVGTNTMWFGPRELGGNLMKGIFIDDVTQYLAGQPMRPYGEFTYSGGDFSLLQVDEWRSEIEGRGLYWSLDKESAKCFRGTVMTYAGQVVMGRHLWLKLTNITSPTILRLDEPNITIA